MILILRAHIFLGIFLCLCYGRLDGLPSVRSRCLILLGKCDLHIYQVLVSHFKNLLHTRWDSLKDALYLLKF